MYMSRKCILQKINVLHDLLASNYGIKSILTSKRHIYSQLRDDFSDIDKNINHNTITFMADKYGIPKWYLDNYYKEVFENRGYSDIYGKDQNRHYYMVLFPGRYKNCQFIDRDKAMKAIQMMIYTDLRSNEEYKK